MTMTRPTFTMSDAAKLVGVSRSTIRRYREAGYFPDAFQDADRQWMIPIENLLAKGLKPVGELTKTTTLMAPAQAVDEPSSPDTPTLLIRLKDAEHALELERAERAGIERLLHEVERRADLAERALLMIESPAPKAASQDHSPIIATGPMVTTDSPTPPQAHAGHIPAVVSTPKKPWWKRG